MKICLISEMSTKEFYGQSTRPYYISKYLHEFGNDVLHICTKYENNEGIRYVEKHHYRHRIKMIKWVKDYLYLRNEIKKFNPDVIYPHQLGNANIALWLNLTLNKKIVYDAHSSGYFEAITVPNNPYYRERKKLRRIEKKVLNKVEKVITVSKETKEYLMKEYGIIDKKISIVKNGTITATFIPKEKNENILKKLGISKIDKICIFICPRPSGKQYSTFSSKQYSALYYFFEMIPEIEKEIDNIKFLIVGGGPEPKPPSNNIIYTGFVGNLPDYINLGDVCIEPSPPKAVCGGTRNKICDYLACGKPIVSTAEGMRGFDDAIPGKHFLLGKDKEDFVDKLVYCLNNPDESKKIGRNARELSRNYDWKVLARKVEEILKRFSE